MPVLFFTGYPGFLGSELLPRLLQRFPDTTALCLVQPKFAAMARERARPLGERVRFVEGDITRRIDADPSGVTRILHLAALYDLSLPRRLGLQINVEGTANVLDFAERCRSLQRLHYVSTCYVSGRHDGLFREQDLDAGQRFNNFYEETKFLAEVAVRQRSGIPWTTYRPSVVVGDSVTGATQKFDGPYFVMRWLLRQPRLAVLPVVGNPRRCRFNVVPRDFIVDALEQLVAHPDVPGLTYQLADPQPLTVDETIRAIAQATGRTIVRLPLPLRVAKFSIDHLPGVRRLMGIPSAAVDYFVQPTTYDTTNAQAALMPAGIKVPPFAGYLPRLVEFALAHPEIGSAAMA